MKSPLTTLRKRGKSVSKEPSVRSPIGSTPELKPVRSRKNKSAVFLDLPTRASDDEDQDMDTASGSRAGIGIEVYSTTSTSSSRDTSQVGDRRTEQEQKDSATGRSGSDGGSHNNSHNNTMPHENANSGFISGFLSVAQNVGNQITSITSPVDLQKPMSELDDHQIHEKIKNNEKLLSSVSQDEVDNGVSMKDIQFKNINDDSPIATLGKGSLSLTDFGISRSNLSSQDNVAEKGTATETKAAGTGTTGSEKANPETLPNQRKFYLPRSRNSTEVQSTAAENSVSMQRSLSASLSPKQLRQRLSLLQKDQDQQKEAFPTMKPETKLLPEVKIHPEAKNDGANSPARNSFTAHGSDGSPRNFLVNRLPIKVTTELSPRRSMTEENSAADPEHKRVFSRSRTQSMSRSNSKAARAPDSSNLADITDSSVAENTELDPVSGSATITGPDVHVTNRKKSKRHKKQSIASAVDVSNLTFASSRKQKEFHATFRKLPETEQLYNDYVCALSKEILLQGKLFVSQHYLSFNANILGWVTNFSIPLEEIVQIEKKFTAGFIPNAIFVQTLHSKYLFTSFISRDGTFDLLTSLWDQIIRGDVEKKRRVSMDLSDDDESYDSEFETDSDFSDSELNELSDMDDMTDSSGESEINGGNGKDSNGVSGANADAGGSAGTSEENEAENGNRSGSADGAPLNGLPVFGPLKHAPTKSPWVKKAGETEIQSSTLPVPPGTVYQLLFGETQKAFLQKLITRQKNINISEIGDYKTNPETGLKERKYDYIKPLSAPVGPKQTRCFITETIESVDDEVIQVVQATKSPDVPSGNSFIVRTRFYFTWAENNGCLVQVVTTIEWSGKSWLKSAIESGTISGQKEAIGILFNLLNEEISSKTSGKSGKGRKRSKTKSKGDAKLKKRSTRLSMSKNDTNDSADPETADFRSIFSKTYEIFETLAKLTPFVFIPVEIKAYILMGLAIFFFVIPGLMSMFSKNKNTSLDSLDDVTLFDSQTMIIPPLYRLENNNMLRNELQIGIWDWVEKVVDQEMDKKPGTDSVVEHWKEKYYDAALTQKQKDYYKGLIEKRQLSKKSEMYSEQELKEYIRLNELRLNELKKKLNLPK